MPLQQYISGAYFASYKGLSTGDTESGFTITQDVRQENIERSDRYGDSMLDYVWRGGNVSCTYTALQARVASTVSAFWPFSSNRWQLSGSANPIGRLASDMAGPFIMTSTAFTPAAAQPASITAGVAIIAPNFSFEDLYDSRLRKIQIRLQYLPYSLAGAVVWAVAT